ncbi:MAG TPA: DUF4230 domain-containing protein [Chthonomonadaceae bacterium]|nr:DUF4230 domain-containing protein [Chthonomonadaceae bacterium]
MSRWKFTPAPVAAAPVSSAGPLKAFTLFGLLLLGLGLGLGWLVGHRAPASGDLPADTGPLLLAIENKGELHTITYRWKDVFHEESESQPGDWAAGLPGATALVHWATGNCALVTAEGSVDAGLNLSALSAKDVTRVSQADGTTRLLVHLPPITVYPPNVHVWIEHQDSGPFWHDDNIAPKAQEQAGRRIVEAAEQDGIRAKARANALKDLQQLGRQLGYTDVDFTF